MCGLFGLAVSKPTPRLGQLTIQLAIENVSRGRTSWGVCLNGSKIIKAVGPIDQGLWKVPMISKGVLIGHTRAPTTGAHTMENSHPWEFPMKGGGTIIGAHNGTVGNHEELNKKYDRKFEVDSMHIFGHIADGLDRSELVGYGAVTFIKQHHLYLCKFNGGVLSIAQLENDKKEPMGIVWSSEEHVLRKALTAANLNYFIYDLVEDETYFYAEDALWKSKEKIGITSYEKHRSSQFTGYGGAHRGHDNHYRRDPQFGKNDSKRNERYVRLQITRETPKPLPPASPEALALETIKIDITSNAALSTHGNITSKCVKCESMTTRRFLGKIVMCLTCIAKMVQSGEVKATGSDVELSTEEVGHA